MANEFKEGKLAAKLHRAFVCCERLLAIHALPPFEEHLNPCLPAVRSEERSERPICYSQTPHIHEGAFPSGTELRPPLWGRVNLSVLHQLSATEGAGKQRPALPRRHSVGERYQESALVQRNILDGEGRRRCGESCPAGGTAEDRAGW
jgi:hypothetical protein